MSERWKYESFSFTRWIKYINQYILRQKVILCQNAVFDWKLCLKSRWHSSVRTRRFADRVDLWILATGFHCLNEEFQGVQYRQINERSALSSAEAASNSVQTLTLLGRDPAWAHNWNFNHPRLRMKPHLRLRLKTCTEWLLCTAVRLQTTWSFLLLIPAACLRVLT